MILYSKSYTVTLLFSEFLTKLAIESKLPFSLDFKLKTRGANKAIKNVIGLEIPCYNQLLVRERYFIDAFQKSIIKQATSLQIELEKLAFKANEDLSLGSMALARLVVLGGESPSDELATKAEETRSSDRYSEWAANNAEAIQTLLEQSLNLNNERFNEACRITFLLASRTGGEWSLEDTMMLTDEEYFEVVYFYLEEAGLKELQPEPVSQPDVVEDLGKE